MDGFRVLFGSDMHGNKKQYTKFFNRALEKKANIVILGGDLTPKDPLNRTPEKQKEFLTQFLFPLIKKFNRNCSKEKTRCDLFIILGNDDFRANEKIMHKNEKSIGYHYISNKYFSVDNELIILGYSFVPLTPFKYKDWEKLDSNKESELVTRKDALMQGVIHRTNSEEKISFSLSNRDDTIEHDLLKLFNEIKSKKIILVSHAPPFGTNIDLTHNKKHVGSRALRKIIEKYAPFVSLSGHIHETVETSGKYIDFIGETVCLTTGNDYHSSSPTIIEFNTRNIKQAKRTII